jgi:predicted transcriptional regulator
MRTTVDLDSRLLERTKRLATEEGRTLSAVLGDALTAYLASRRRAAVDSPFELLVRGEPRGRFPTPAEITAIEEEEDMAALAVLPKETGRRVSP